MSDQVSTQCFHNPHSQPLACAKITGFVIFVLWASNSNWVFWWKYEQTGIMSQVSNQEKWKCFLSDSLGDSFELAYLGACEFFLATVGILSKEMGKGGGGSDRSPCFYFICLFGYFKPVILWACLKLLSQLSGANLLGQNSNLCQAPLGIWFFWKSGETGKTGESGNQVKQVNHLNEVN